MVKNIIEVDDNVEYIENGTVQAQIVEDIRRTRSCVNRIIKNRMER